MKPMQEAEHSPLNKLHIADPDTYVWVKGRLSLISPPPDDMALDLLVELTIWGLSQEAGVGEAVAKGLLDLIPMAGQDDLIAYETLVRQAAETGPTFGRIMASFLAPVLMRGKVFLSRFKKTVAVMQGKGTYTLNAPLEVLVDLLSADEAESAGAYLDLLDATFSQPLTYNQSLRLVYLIPKAVSGFLPNRRRSQIDQFVRVVSADLKLVDDYLDGVERGTGLLDGPALEDFVGQALEHYTRAPAAGTKFLSLSSKLGQDACTALQRAVPYSQVSASLNRYLSARMGRAIAVKPASGLPLPLDDAPWVCSDGVFIYLRDEIGLYDSREANETLYWALTRFEAGFFECRSFDLDLERAADTYPEIADLAGGPLVEADPGMTSDGERFLDLFARRDLAADLFDIFEQARVSLYLRQQYPGLMRHVLPVFRCRWTDSGALVSDHLLAPVYAELVLHSTASTYGKEPSGEVQRRLVDLFVEGVTPDSPVESVARLVCVAYQQIQASPGRNRNRYEPLALPFDRRLRWDLIRLSFAAQARNASQIQLRLREKGLRVYRSDLRNRLSEQGGLLTADDVAELVLTRGEGGENAAQLEADLSALDWDALLGRWRDTGETSRRMGDDAFCYPEWDHLLQDYLYDHTRVYELDVPEDSDEDFYSVVLSRYRGLLAHMRRAFELLKPEGLTLLRQWPEGDAFDYRALLDFVMDRRAGLIPSDRFFIKRLKQERDVAVMLLVDLSRSTANPVSGGHATVLDVAKEAVVLFCEALDVVGDDFAIAGFSGTGRHSVDFFGIKRFGEVLNRAVQSRISSLQPQRSTRMGAAIRHAGALLAQADARVRLMIIVSDGFPNDLGYKSDYAIADTRRAVQEVRSRNFHVKAITVNVGSDPRLDDLYGRTHHHVIGDVRELPDKLLRLYGTLTRF